MVMIYIIHSAFLSKEKQQYLEQWNTRVPVEAKEQESCSLKLMELRKDKQDHSNAFDFSGVILA